MPTADEVIVETPPEALANIMHTVESGVTPECPPDQIFHTLFEEKTNEQSVILRYTGGLKLSAISKNSQTVAPLDLVLFKTW